MHICVFLFPVDRTENTLIKLVFARECKASVALPVADMSQPPIATREQPLLGVEWVEQNFVYAPYAIRFGSDMFHHLVERLLPLGGFRLFAELVQYPTVV